MQTTHSETQFCEEALQRQKDHCIHNGVYLSWPLLIEQMLNRRDELATAYSDIYTGLGGSSKLADVFFDAILCAASVWDPASTAEVRRARKRLLEVNEEISELADELSARLEERSSIQNKHSIGTNAHFCVIDLIVAASKENYLFQSWVQDDLKTLSSRFDMKYWPSLSQVLDVISEDAAEAEIEVHDPITEAAISSSRHSKADFCRAVLERVDVCKNKNGGGLPSEFHLKDDTWASLINVVLDLDADSLVNGEYVKGVRQRTRERFEAD